MRATEFKETIEKEIWGAIEGSQSLSLDDARDRRVLFDKTVNAVMLGIHGVLVNEALKSRAKK